MDLIFFQYKLDVEKTVYQPALGKSDHVVINYDYNQKDKISMDEPKKRKNKRLNCAKANIKGTKQYLKDKDW